MAIIQKSKVVRNATGPSYYRGEFGAFAAVNDADNAVFLGDDGYDLDTLYPLIDAQPAGLTLIKGDRNFHVRNSILMDRPIAYADHNRMVTDIGGARYTAQPVNWSSSMLRNRAFTNTMDKTLREKTGNFFSFEDSSGKVHYLVQSMGSGFSVLYSSCNKRVVLVQGNSLQNPEASVAYDYSDIPTNVTGNTYYNQQDFIHPFYVDTVAQRIFCFSDYKSASSTYTYDWMRHQHIMYFNYTTVADGGTLAITGASYLAALPRPGTTPGLHISDPYQYHFCGLANDGSMLLMMTSENDASLTALTVNGSRWNGTAVGWNKSGNHRMVFFKIDTTSLGSTTLADLSGSSFLADPAKVRRYSGQVANSVFQQSPIAGEGSIYYAYSVAFHETNISDATVFRIKWDKTDDSFTLAEVNLSAPLQDYFHDAIGRWTSLVTDLPFNSTGWYNLVAIQQTTLNVVLSKTAGGDFTLSFFNTLGGSFGVSRATTKMGNLVTYQLDSSDMLTATFAASQAMSSIYSYTVGDEDCNELMFITNSGIETWKVGVGGWSDTSRIGGKFLGFGKDSVGRYWALGLEGTDSQDHFITLHSLIPSLAQQMVITFEDSSINYAGTTLSKNVLVSAYDESGARVAVNAVLKLTGGNAVFTSNGARSLSINTSDAGDTTVGLTITGAGFINVSASFETP